MRFFVTKNLGSYVSKRVNIIRAHILTETININKQFKNLFLSAILIVVFKISSNYFLFKSSYVRFFDSDSTKIF